MLISVSSLFFEFMIFDFFGLYEFNRMYLSGLNKLIIQIGDLEKSEIEQDFRVPRPQNVDLGITNEAFDEDLPVPDYEVSQNGLTDIDIMMADEFKDLE